MEKHYLKGFNTKTCVLLLTLLSFFLANAQNRSAAYEKVSSQASFFDKTEPKKPISRLNNVPSQAKRQVEKGIDVNKALFFSFDDNVVAEIVSEKSERMVMNLPYVKGSSLELQLVKSKVLTDEFKVYKGTDRNKPIEYKKGAHYWGIVKGDTQSMVAISFYGDEIVGNLKVFGKSYDLGKIRNNLDKHHILYENKDIREQFDLECSTPDESEHMHKSSIEKVESSSSLSSGNCVKMYLETDYSMYEHYGSVEAVTNYVTGAFNQVILLYANESINMSINELVVWDVVDPYPGTDTSSILTQFRDELSGNYNGDLAHLIIKSSEVSGGRAYLNVLCNKTYGVGVSGIGTSYNDIPNYSWTVMVLAHEIGHNLGSSHTHSCKWNGDNTVIDDCGNVYYMTNGRDDNGDNIVDNLDDAQAFSPCFDNVNNIIPSEGGTVMSYCHLNSVGIDLSLGFGQQPGDLIRNRVANATCLSACVGGPLLAEVSSTNVTCGSSNDGAASVAASGGTGNYSYSWSNGATSASISNLEPGFYTVTVNDGNESISDSVTIVDNNSTYYADVDGDGFGDLNTSILACSQPNDYVENNKDCDDSDSLSYPGADEICDGKDNDCDGIIDEDLTVQTYYADADGDSYGDPNNTLEDCTPPTGYVSNNTDCNDNDITIYPGGTCDDGNDCTINDAYDNDCNCVGTPTDDSDLDGVCDALDVCPNGDDRIDIDGDSIPDDCDDCNSAVENFSVVSLSHSGSGIAEATIYLPKGSRGATFTISGINSKTGGKPASRYIEQVTVYFIFGDNVKVTYGTFSSTSSVNVNIAGEVDSITVELEDIYSGNTDGNMNITLGTINYCKPWNNEGCPDTDEDGICNENDMCPGYNDNIDSDGDTVPDGCDICPEGDDRVDSDGDGVPDDCDTANGCENIVTTQFNSNPLTHSGNGSSSVSVDFTEIVSNVSFSISDVDQITGGKKSNRYSEYVEVTYVDENNNTIEYGIFDGVNAEISISGAVQIISVHLSDGTGNNNTDLSISLSDISYCSDAPIAPALEGLPEVLGNIDNNNLVLYPNPSKSKVYVRWTNMVNEVKVTFYDVLGKKLQSKSYYKQNFIMLDTSKLSGGNMYFLTFEVPGQQTQTRKLILLDY
ncbi:M12 family metallo-peptidase [Seonamhaeicola aphaedonensis]|uniref:Putative secreted protein (Por secretion system target) n=1 Tax=Seonamhaeicola aphaedonensis TaxID=1461338 RepID=A0A3D9HIG5_9FLAO|nr:M12 family metallo-peptidase [Seonamhaeicola aphaedonensis]RED49287.1 putative secreted protein (Por secretion system target) [Seonamhaeicola aphaedonensis]